ncbi:unnamed protein product [Polarella glacialis]|nr:unnamed protein product [Polarella glacialis]
MKAQEQARIVAAGQTNGVFNECTPSGTNRCPMSSFGGRKTIVRPGGQTSCLDSSGGEYAFLVTPGDTDKLLFYLQGGGACWDPISWAIGACTKNITFAFDTSGMRSGKGMFNPSNGENVYQKFTIVEILYCSGDGHVGNTTRNFTDSSGDGYRKPQVGHQNVKAALDWTLANTDAKLSQLTITGDSAGALGTQAWANSLLQEKFKYEKANVIVDSYAAYFPADTTAPTIQSFGACDLPIFTQAQQTLCTDGVLTVPMFMSQTIQGNPLVPFAYLQSKADLVQRGFYDLIWFTYVLQGRTSEQNWLGISGPDFYSGTNELFQVYNEFSNFAVFYVDGETHTFTEMDWYYTAGTLGSTSGSPHNQPPMYEWVNGFTEGDGCPGSQCNSQLEGNNADSTEYCDQQLFPKSCSVSTAPAREVQ